VTAEAKQEPSDEGDAKRRAQRVSPGEETFRDRLAHPRCAAIDALGAQGAGRFAADPSLGRRITLDTAFIARPS